jgi:hypothetical protein
LVEVFAVVIATLFHEEPAAPVMLARFVTEIALLTKYAVPISVEVTAAFSAAVIDPAVKAAVGAVVSTTIAEFAPSEPAEVAAARVSVALFKATSRIVPPFKTSEAVSTYVKSADVSPA